jgi:putative DNA primase/helicase
MNAPEVNLIPEEMRQRDQWVCYRLVSRPGKEKPDKVPIDPKTGKPASTTDSLTWASFEKAVSVSPKYDGIGFVFSSGDPFAGIDLDGCRDSESGRMEEWAEALLAGLGGYAEVSPSGRGVHVIVKGRLPEGARHKIEREDGGCVEAYDERRFFTMTGRALR